MKLYHLDKDGTLSDGQKIELQSLENLTEEIQKSYFARDFQNGVSKHGQSYLSTELKPNPLWWTPDGTPLIPACEFESVKKHPDAQIIELVSELVRRCYFPSLPSRMTSLFAVKEISDLEEWPELGRKPQTQIFEIDAPDDTPKFDSRLLCGGLSLCYAGPSWFIGLHVSGIFDAAYRYWSGEISDNPRFEYLVQLPIGPIHKLNG